MTNVTSARWRRTKSEVARIIFFSGFALFLLNSDRLWGWAIGAGLLLIPTWSIYRFANDSLRSMDTDILAAPEKPIEDDLSAALSALEQQGFAHQLRFEAGGHVAVSQSSEDETIVAVVYPEAVDGGTRLTTRWSDAVLRTTSGDAVPLGPREYVQRFQATKTADLIAAHRKGIEILSTRFGRPQQAWRTISEFNEIRRRDREAFASHRYRYASRGLLGWYLGGRYRGRVDQHLALDGTARRLWILAGLSWAIAAGVWLWAISSPWASATALAVSYTALLLVATSQEIAWYRDRSLFLQSRRNA